MPPPILQNTAALVSSGTSIPISASFTSPTSGNYRVLVLHTNDNNNGVPLTASTPSGWTLLYVSPRGRAGVRTWVWGQVWSGSSPAGTITLNANVYYLALGARLSGFTQPPWVPLITTPGITFDDDSSHDAASLSCQADSLRIDFWGAFYNAGANTASMLINTPFGQTGSGNFRGSTGTGYVGKVTYETLLVKGLTGVRTATMTDPASSVVLSLAIGGWTEYTKATISTMGLGSSVAGSKQVTRPTSTSLGLAGTSLGSGRATTGESSTAMAIASTSQRVYLTSTTLGLASSCVGTHDTVAESIDNVGLKPTVVGTHINNPVDTTTELTVASTSVARVGGGGAPPSIVDQYTDQYQPSLRPLRFMFQRIRDGQWLNWDVALTEPEITWTLSGPTMIRGKVGPEDIEVIRGIDAWGTWLHVEESGIIRASAILQPLSIQGDDLMIEAAGVHGYAVGIQFESEFSAIQIDAAEAMRQLWAYLQWYPDARLGVTLDPTLTGRKLGDPARIEVKVDNFGQVVYKELRLEEQYGGLYRVNMDDVPDFVFATLLSWGHPLYQDTTTGQYVILATPNDYSMATTGYPAIPQEETASDGTVTIAWFVPEFTYIPAKPYEIAWWNELDVGREIENLAKQTPFDFAETPYWTEDRLDVQQHISIGYPRLGTKRFDLRFAEDENLFAAVLVRESPSFYASQVIVRGAGEGRTSVRGQAGGNNPHRVRRVTSLTDKTITTRERAAALAAEELYRRLAAYTISEITIDATHDNAPMGSFALGDDILVQANLPYYGEVQLWHRILAYTWVPDRNEVRLTLRRSEQFVYGRVLPA